MVQWAVSFVCWVTLRLIALCFWFLVEKKTIAACFYIHTAAASAWSHAGGVERNAHPTPVQALKNVAEAKQKLVLKQSCGTL